VRTSRPGHVVALAVVGSGFLAGCIFNNTLHNAEGLYKEAENLRLAGQDSAGRAGYDEVVARATKAYQSDEDGRWADDALLLIAKSQLRLGAIPDADQALERVLEISTDSDVRGQAALYRGALAVTSETRSGGLLFSTVRSPKSTTRPTSRRAISGGHAPFSSGGWWRRGGGIWIGRERRIAARSCLPASSESLGDSFCRI